MNDYENHAHMITLGVAIARVYLSDYSTSDNGQYGAYGLALLNEIRTWCGVEKGAVTKNDYFTIHLMHSVNGRFL